MNLTGKKIAILGGTRIACEIVRAAKALGMKTYVLDYNPPEKSPAKLIADENALVSVIDTEAVSEYIRQHEIDGIMTGFADSILPAYADACAATGLPCYATRSLFELFTDKSKWKKLCLAYGVPVAQPVDLESDSVSGHLPIIVKPSDGSGARGVTIVRSPDQIESAVRLARSSSKNGEIIAEEFLEGTNVTVFWLFIDGHYEVSMIADMVVKDSQGGANPLIMGYIYPSNVLPRYLDEVAPKARRMFEAAGVKNGMMFMQCIVKNGLPHVFDIGYRTTGSFEYIPSKAASGLSALDMLLHHAITGRMYDGDDLPARIKKLQNAPAFSVDWYMRPGTLGSFAGIEAVESDSAVTRCVQVHAPGDIIPQSSLGLLDQWAFGALGTVDTREQLKENILRIQDKMRILSPDGEDITLPGINAGDLALFGL